MKARTALVGVACLALLTPVTTLAQGWDRSVCALGILPNDSSEIILDTGSAVTVDDGYTPDVDLDIMFNECRGLEVIAAAAERRSAPQGSAAPGTGRGPSEAPSVPE